jgi:hypothetical protein
VRLSASSDSYEASKTSHYQPDAARGGTRPEWARESALYCSRFILQSQYWTAVQRNDFGYRFGYRHQFGLISASYAKLQVEMGLAGSLIMLNFPLFIIDLRYSWETQNPRCLGCFSVALRCRFDAQSSTRAGNWSREVDDMESVLHGQDREQNFTKFFTELYAPGAPNSPGRTSVLH